MSGPLWTSSEREFAEPQLQQPLYCVRCSSTNLGDGRFKGKLFWVQPRINFGTLSGIFFLRCRCVKVYIHKTRETTNFNFSTRAEAVIFWNEAQLRLMKNGDHRKPLCRAFLLAQRDLIPFEETLEQLISKTNEQEKKAVEALKK